ncbi:MAG: sulfotransferase family 2 domain-containing protein, partial [Pseudomonadota bacterium]
MYTYLLKQSLGGNTEFPTNASEVLSDDEIRERATDIFKRYFKFASVRNPWARVVSLYKRREGVKVSDRMDFEVFCEGFKYASDTCSHPTRAISQL